MPSDDPRTAIVEALAPRRVAYRSALAATLDELRAILAGHREAVDDREVRLAATLGPVGARHVDVRRLAGLLAPEAALGPRARDVIGRALGVLEELERLADAAMTLALERGGSLYEAATRLLSTLGRGMAAGRVAGLARSGRYRPAEHDAWLERFPFGLWSQDERRLAPPILIELDGADLKPSGLAEFLDGRVAIVLLVRGTTSPAPLVRLITPRTFVAQTSDPTVLGRLLGWEGAGIVAFMPEGSARFVHDPAGGDRIAARLSIDEMPPLDGRRRTGSFTAAQQEEEMSQLAALRAAVDSAPPVIDGAETKPDDPVDKLAAWLLQQADLSES